MTLEELKALPKIELHCHLDGSLSREFLESRLGRKVEPSEIHVSDDCQSLQEYLEKFDLPGQCLQDEKGLELAGYDVLKSMSQENVRYAEVRFAPLLSENENLIITCAMRHHSYEENLRMIWTAREYLGNGVCAADLAGAEAIYPMSEFMELFGQAKKLGMPFTIHAGECGNAQNISDAVRVGAGRIGHGIAMRGNRELQRELAAKGIGIEMIREKGIGVEMCPISNLQTKAVESESQYPLREFLDNGIKVTINTDNRTVSNTTMTKELQFIQEHYRITDEEIRLMMRNAVDTAFIH